MLKGKLVISVDYEFDMSDEKYDDLEIDTEAEFMMDLLNNPNDLAGACTANRITQCHLVK